jgi:hypothetical protein
MLLTVAMLSFVVSSMLAMGAGLTVSQSLSEKLIINYKSF